METPINVVRPRQPDEIDDSLTEVLRSRARRLLAQAVELEADAFLSAMQDMRLPDGRARLVRHGHGPEREIQTGIGLVPVARVRVRDRGATGPSDRVRFTSTILPRRYSIGSRSLDALLLVLYLRGISTSDFQEDLAALLGKDALTSRPRFQSMVRSMAPDKPKAWTVRADASLVASFARGIAQDKAAVSAAITLPWSNGQTEGQITKLKLVKRQMYGRGKLDLLQARLIGFQP